MGKIESIIDDQKAKVDQKYGHIKSLHEGYGLAMEEYEELTEELKGYTQYFNQFWEGVKKNSVDINNYYGKSLADALRKANRIIEESIDLVVVLIRLREAVQRDKNME